MKRLLVLILALAPVTAHADWQYTHWGMTAHQIKGAAVPPQSGVPCAFEASGKPIATGHYREFDVAFCSRDGRTLESVTLRANGSPEPIRRELLSTYGQPISRSPVVTIWNDTKHRNTVTFIDIAGVGAVVEYKPMGTHAKGL